MKAAILDTLGGVPRYGDFPDSAPRAGETLVRVTAAAIKPLDRAIAAGTHYSSPRALPVVCGTDGTGELASGEPVYFAAGNRPYGSMAERALASWTVSLPAGLDPAMAAAAVNPALAAWLPLQWRARLQPGETVLVTGATGAAGRMTIAAARLLGAGRIVAAGRRQGVLAQLGADATIDLAAGDNELREAFGTHAAAGIDVVVDFVWGRPAELLIEALIRSDLVASPGLGGTRFVSVGEMAGPTISLPSAALRGSRLELLGSGTANFPPIEGMQSIVAEILRRTAAGELSADIERVPLSRVTEVWANAGDRRPVLTPDR